MNLRFVSLAVFAGLDSCAPARPAAIPSTPVPAATPMVAVGPQYEATHVYVTPEDVDRFVQSFLATFGGTSTKQIVSTITPTPGRTTLQALRTPVGTVSLFAFKTPIPYPFGLERTGDLVEDIDDAVQAARLCGAEVVVEKFRDPIGLDVIIQWPGGVNMQLYWHTTKPAYPAFQTVPENRVYVSPDRVSAFVGGVLRFSHGALVSDDAGAPGIEIGRPDTKLRRIRLESAFGKIVVLVTDGHLPYPYGRELTGYEVTDLAETLAKATAAGATVLIEPYASDHRRASMVLFPGGYVAEIHASAP
jgi:hypothetical protein